MLGCRISALNEAAADLNERLAHALPQADAAGCTFTCRHATRDARNRRVKLDMNDGACRRLQW